MRGFSHTVIGIVGGINEGNSIPGNVNSMKVRVNLCYLVTEDPRLPFTTNSGALTGIEQFSICRDLYHWQLPQQC